MGRKSSDIRNTRYIQRENDIRYIPYIHYIRIYETYGSVHPYSKLSYYTELSTLQSICNRCLSSGRENRRACCSQNILRKERPRTRPHTCTIRMRSGAHQEWTSGVIQPRARSIKPSVRTAVQVNETNLISFYSSRSGFEFSVCLLVFSFRALGACVNKYRNKSKICHSPIYY